MQTVSDTLKNSLNNGYVNKALPKLLIEWNQNRYAGILKIENTPTEATQGYDIENYPIDTIAEPQRPKSGIIKARTSRPANQPKNSNGEPLPWPREHNAGGDEGFAAEDYNDAAPADRYYTVGEKSAYKYWCSPEPSTYTQGFNGSYVFRNSAEATVQPYIIYKTQARVNKIVLTFEATWSRPVDYDIQTTVNGGNLWQTVASNIRPDANGHVTIYRHANGLAIDGYMPICVRSNITCHGLP